MYYDNGDFDERLFIDQFEQIGVFFFNNHISIYSFVQNFMFSCSCEED